MKFFEEKQKKVRKKSKWSYILFTACIDMSYLFFSYGKWSPIDTARSARCHGAIKLFFLLSLKRFENLFLFSTWKKSDHVWIIFAYWFRSSCLQKNYLREKISCLTVGATLLCFAITQTEMPVGYSKRVVVKTRRRVEKARQVKMRKGRLTKERGEKNPYWPVSRTKEDGRPSTFFFSFYFIFLI